MTRPRTATSDWQCRRRPSERSDLGWEGSSPRASWQCTAPAPAPQRGTQSAEGVAAEGASVRVVSSRSPEVAVAAATTIAVYCPWLLLLLLFSSLLNRLTSLSFFWKVGSFAVLKMITAWSTVKCMCVLVVLPLMMIWSLWGDLLMNRAGSQLRQFEGR